MNNTFKVGMVGFETYLPSKKITAKENSFLNPRVHAAEKNSLHMPEPEKKKADDSTFMQEYYLMGTI